MPLRADARRPVPARPWRRSRRHSRDFMDGAGPAGPVAPTTRPHGAAAGGPRYFEPTPTAIGSLAYAVLTTKLIETCPMTQTGTASIGAAFGAAWRTIFP